MNTPGFSVSYLTVESAAVTLCINNIKEIQSYVSIFACPAFVVCFRVLPTAFANTIWLPYIYIDISELRCYV